MAVESIAAGFGGVGGSPVPVTGSSDVGGLGGSAGLAQPAQAPSAPPVQEASLEARAARGAGPAETPASRAPTPEVPAGPRQPGQSIGNSVLDGVDKLQKGDGAWRSGEGGPARAANEPTLRVGARPPGPAAAHMAADAGRGPEIAGQPTTQPGKSRNPSFDDMVHQLEQVSGQVVQVSIVSKTTSSFTGSLNKLLSSG